MIVLIAGLLLWISAHAFKRVAPGRRAAMGDKGRGLIAFGILTGMVLMVLGYRMADYVPVYSPIAGMGHLNNLLMFVAVYCFGITPSRGVLVDKLRHPMLTAVVIWGIAHLLVNGDLASVLLFGGLATWAVMQMLLINNGDGAWDRPPPGTARGDQKNVVITLVIFTAVAAVHVLLGHNPFLGTYG